METGYLKALEKRLVWLQWAQREVEYSSPQQDILPQYIKTLEAGDTFYMNDRFCELVSHARETIPDDILFEETWMQARQGWIWLEKPFKVPAGLIPNPQIPGAVIPASEIDQVDISISAIGWLPLHEGDYTQKNNEVVKVGKGASHFVLFMDKATNGMKKEGFVCWSYFMLQHGDKLIDRIHDFEATSALQGGAYTAGRDTDMQHEIRWIYSAFYLMAQRLAVNVEKKAERAYRRRTPEVGKIVPDFVRVVTLRRLEEAREKARKLGEPEPVDWQWQWEVRGHWRNQYFRSTGEHKQVFIEAYIKGPDDRPLKPPGHKLFVARR